MSNDLFKLLAQFSGRVSLLDFFDQSSCDEMAEINIKNDTYKHIYHVLGKYAAGNAPEGYRGIYQFARDNVVHPDDLEAYCDLMDPEGFEERMAHAPFPNFRSAEFRYRLQNGQWRYVAQYVVGGAENGLAPGTYRFYVFDVQNRVNRQSGKDNAQTIIFDQVNPLTGLNTEHAFYRLAEEAIAQHPDYPWCMIFIDIEHFRLFDDWYGRDKGDLVLKGIGEALRHYEKTHNAVAGYFGFDDFALLLPFDMSVIEQIYEDVRAPILSFSYLVGFLPAIGVYKLEKSVHLTEAFDRASIASSYAKGDIKNRIRLFDSRRHLLHEREYTILTDFISALENDEITFFLQPQVRISSRQIVGAESLVRWVKKNGEIVSPGVFVPILEKYGFISDLDKRVWEKVCAFQREQLDKGLKTVPISVNVSQVDIFMLDLPKLFGNLLRRYKLPPNLLKIEITESAYASNATLVRNVVAALRKKGLLVFMDDFGSGYSSLNMLSGLNVDVIKLDAQFINVNEEEKAKGVHILESIVNMTKSLAIPIIVEGAETKRQIDFLEGIGCRYVQGYYFYKPMPIADFVPLINQEGIIDDRGIIAKLNEQMRIREFLDQNVFSDSMLNSILGPVAFYLLHDDDVDIIRFNQQFYESVNVPDFQQRLESIQRFLPEGEHKILLQLLHQAMEDRYNGAKGLLHFYKTDMSLTSYNMHFFYLGEQDGGHRFYGSAENITKYTDLLQQLHYIGGFFTDTIGFLKRIEGKTEFTISAHGLENVLALSKEEFEQELNTGKFYSRIINQDGFGKQQDEEAFANHASFFYTFKIRNAKDEVLTISMKGDPISDKLSNYSYILVFHQENT